MTHQRGHVNLAIIGTFPGVGGVGAELIKQIQAYNQRITETNSRSPILSVICVARSSACFCSKDFQAIDLSSWKSYLDSGSDHHPSKLEIDDLIDYLSLSPTSVIFVDNTSDENVASSYPKLLQRKISIATPNKKAFSGENGLYDEMQNAVSENTAYVYHEATVGAGLPVISTLQDLIATGDEVHKIEGIFSGTMSYLFNQWSPSGSPGKLAFSSIVAKAKEAGYTEPDPRDDLNGMDVARKVTILARVAGFPLKGPSSFPVQSLIPQALQSANGPEEFMSKLPQHDSHYAKIRTEAEKNGKCVRYVGSIDLRSGEASVKMEQFPNSHPFAGLQGSDNVIAFYTKRYSPQPLIIQGSGAGAPVTAMGVLADIIKIAQRAGR